MIEGRGRRFEIKEDKVMGRVKLGEEGCSGQAYTGCSARDNDSLGCRSEVDEGRRVRVEEGHVEEEQCLIFLRKILV